MNKKQNAAATLAAMLAGKPTKETELLRVKASGDVNASLAAKVINESNLPSASEMQFKQVAGKNGVLQIVEASEMEAQGYGSVDTDAIKGLLQGKKLSVINEELRQKQTTTPIPQPKERELPVLDIREEIKRRAQGGTSSSPVTSTKLTEAILTNTESQQGTSLDFDTAALVDLVENTIYDFFGQVLGISNNTLKDKQLIKERVEEAVTFLKLTKQLKNK